MAEVLVLGAGVNGLCAALLLARDGHAVTVVERDPADPPEPVGAWEAWERRGCAQFRLPHYLQPRFRHELADALPDAEEALVAAGALVYDVVGALPERATGGRRDGDDRYTALTARRPVLEAVLAALATAEPGVVVRRGATVRALLAGSSDEPGVPHVAGVVTDTGEVLGADLVVDATGRRSPVPAWLAPLGAAPPREERAPGGFVYYARHFHGDAMPPLLGPVHQQHDSLSVLTLPADNGTWSVALCVSARDRILRGLRDPARWTATVRAYPLAAPWVDATPITGVVGMAGLEDRLRTTVVDGHPVVTGLLLLGDSWGCTDPSLGRGASIGLLHTRLLRDVLRETGCDRPAELARRWDAGTRRLVEPWHRATVAASDRRLAELDADREGRAPAADPRSAATALRAAAGRDPDVLRAVLDIASMLEQPAAVLARPGFAERVTTAAAGAPRYPLPGPDRAALLAIAG